MKKGLGYKELNAMSKQICELEEKLLNTEVRTSPDELSRLLADDFFEFGSSGKVWHMRDLMGEEGAGEVRMTLSGFELHPLSGEAVLATYRIMNEETGERHCAVQSGNSGMGSGRCFSSRNPGERIGLTTLCL